MVIAVFVVGYANDCVIAARSNITQGSVQQTRVTDPVLDQYWASVVDAGPTLAQHLVGVSCLPG